MSKSLQPKYRSGSPGQGLVVEGLTVEDIWKGDVKCVKVNGA